MKLLYNPATRQDLDNFMVMPSHAAILTGPKGAGKRATADELAASLLGVDSATLSTYPYFHVISSDKAISIDEVRAIDNALRLKVPVQGTVSRIVIIENAQTMGHEAQNALLKTLEEPPARTTLILVATTAQGLLPTVRSRAQTIAIRPVPREAVRHYFLGAGYPEKTVQQALAVSDGLPGLMHALLTHEDHPLVAATALARSLLQESAYQRLLRVDELSKQKTLTEDMLFILRQMAHARLQAVDGTAANRWQQVMSASYEAGELLRGQVQAKLVLDRLMLDLG